ncbi:hypothetical protein MYX77_04250 [Acidobacteriia bacterium AH_259_A11_L15]|nr:hypothetical protein [Acidobacteriia bacterium AH_259_A11_L15]
MKFDCKVWPVKDPHPAFPKEKFGWLPVLWVRLIHKHSPPTRRFEAIVDSGSPHCLFHANVCRAIGIKRLESGVEDTLKGIVGGPNVPESPLYFHKVKIQVGAEIFETMAGFSSGLAVGGILGRRGFFGNFLVKFDCSTHPPQLEIERLHRA